MKLCGKSIGRKTKCLSLFLIFIFLAWMLLPVVSFETPKSTVLYDQDGHLLGAKLAADQQWRFPPQNNVGRKFKAALIASEDDRFYDHWGIDLKSVARALYLNIKYKKVVSGASTLSMQVSRIALGNKQRSLWIKIYESILTLKLEANYSKDEIIEMYANNAPFGRNVVGIEAASWRFFGCASNKLTWAEASTLAVLPNAPSQIYPGKNNILLRKKRDRLLKKLFSLGKMDKMTYELSLKERVPSASFSFPKNFMHALEFVKNEQTNEVFRTSFDNGLQSQVGECVSRYAIKYRSNELYNISVLVADVESGKVISYVGNVDWTDKHEGAVDMVQGIRSSGSLLKPFLYAAMLDAGYITPRTIIPDYPLFLKGYAPKNFDLKFRGAVGANDALSESLNVPSVFMLQQYSAARFLELLRIMGMSSFNKSADYYGLSLILGGGESNLWQMVGAYASMARTLNGNHKKPFFPLSILSDEVMKGTKSPLSKSSIWNTFNALQTVNRPLNEVGWKYLNSSTPLAWKTGTSFGFKDAWAIGVNPKYAIGVWVGNANGEGRPACTGVQAAAPILFDVYHLLPKVKWFDAPNKELFTMSICHESGFRASKNCSNIDTILVGDNVRRTAPCPYHKVLSLDETESYQVNSTNYPISKMVYRKWFALPPKMAFYYKKFHIEYKSIPPRLPSGDWNDENSIGIIYPTNGMVVIVPKKFTGVRSNVIFRATTTQDNRKLFWFLDGKNVGETDMLHQLSLQPKVGSHRLVVQDEFGNESSVRFSTE